MTGPPLNNMPPRLSSLPRVVTSISAPLPCRPISPFLVPFLNIQSRAASILSSLSDTPGAYSKKIRRGQGPSSGKGKTSGRGHKGQKQHGKVPFGFNGGQTKLEVVKGPRGFTQNFSTDLTTLNLSKLTSWITQNRISPHHPITMRELRQSRCVTNVKDGVKLLASGSELLPDEPLHILVSRASASAIAAIEAKGGTVTTRYYTNFAIKKICEGRMDPIHSLQSQLPFPKREQRFQYRLPDPTSRKDIEYYRDRAHRGYLAHTVPEGHGPSLYFKPLGLGQRVQKKVDKGKIAALEDRLW